MPTELATINPVMPKDQQLRRLADDVLGKLKYSFVAAAAEDQPSAPGELDQMFKRFLATRKSQTRAIYKENAQALLQAPKLLRAREFRRYADVDVQQYRTMSAAQLKAHVGPLNVQKLAIQSALQKYGNLVLKLVEEHQPAVVHIPAGGINVPDPDLQAGLAFKKLKLFIKRVKCIEETDEIGDDEVNMGGTATDPMGQSALVPEWQVHSDFDSGDQVNYGFNKVFHTWSLHTNQDGFPYWYGAVVALAEKDDGGFWKFLQELWTKVESEVKAAIGAAVGAAIGAAIGAAYAGIGAIVGAVIGAFIGWLLGFFADNPDDIIGTKSLVLALGAATKSYYDWAKLTTPEGLAGSMVYKGDGGRYQVDWAFKVATA
jgi:hypothetical protein